MRIVGTAELELDAILACPLVAHLATSCADGPRSSPVWFLWEAGALWILGNRAHDTFVTRIEAEPRCAVSIVDFDPHAGRLHHVGFRGRATVEPFDGDRARRKLRRYLGDDEARWDRSTFTLDAKAKPLVFVCVHPHTVVVRDQTYARG